MPTTACVGVNGCNLGQRERRAQAGHAAGDGLQPEPAAVGPVVAAACRSQRVAVGPRQLRGHSGFEHRQCLAELHRTALQLAQGPEELLRRALLDLRHHQVGVLAAESFAEPERVAPGDNTRTSSRLSWIVPDGHPDHSEARG